MKVKITDAELDKILKEVDRDGSGEVGVQALILMPPETV